MIKDSRRYADAAKYLVEVERVPAFTDDLLGRVSPIISSVTAPSKVVQMCAADREPFTLDGRSGVLFRTIPTSKTPGV
jgi:hypothetical protein